MRESSVPVFRVCTSRTLTVGDQTITNTAEIELPFDEFEGAGETIAAMLRQASEYLAAEEKASAKMMGADHA